VLASAGSGKTYRLSNRIIQLLALGVAPGEILASTFTRKATGEILERVLVRLAKGAVEKEAAAELGAHAHPALDDPAECRRLLARVVEQLHEVNVGTLDAFFVRVARTFFQELGLAPGWTVADRPLEDRLRTEAVLAALEAAEPGHAAQLIRLFNRGSAARRVHDSLAETLYDLLRLRRQVDPSAGDPWHAEFGMEAEEASAALAAQASDLARRIRDLAVPTTQKGEEVKSWVKAREASARALETGDWSSLFDKGIGAKILEGSGEFDRKPIPGEVADLFLEAQQLGRRTLAGPLRQQMEAMGQVAQLLDGAFARVQRKTGAYRFEDVTHLLGGPGAAAGRGDLDYRLDQQVRHLLLDEFQDTSLEQWQALEPLAGELLSGHLGERAGVIVADPKQSIYGWRGARPELVHAVGRAYGLAGETLTRSWRSSGVVLDFVADVFRSLPTNPVVEEIAEGPEVAREWMKDFTELAAARDLPGHVRIHEGPPVSGQGAVQADLLRHAAGIVRELHVAMPERTIGVLVRQNRVLSYLMAELGSQGVPASGEGGSPLTDTPPVNAILSLFQLADHPGDHAARYHVARTPLGALVELADWTDDAAARRLSTVVRRALVQSGYGPTLAGWVEGLAPRCDRRQVQRLLQLVELGHRWDERSTLRPSDFVRYVNEEVVEDPSSARVQVMTIHKAKGLEFDVVVLPELYASLTPKARGMAFPLRDPETGRIVKLYPRMSKKLLPYFPEVTEARQQGRSADLRDALSVLYVALTRARYALHLVVPPEQGSAKSAARLIRHALAGAPEANLERGDPRWHLNVGGGRTVQPTAEATRRHAPRTPPLATPAAGPGRNLPRRSPSSMEGGDAVDLAFHLRLDAGPALRRGDVVHAWCEAVVWLDDGIPEDATLAAIARRVAPGMPEREAASLAADFRRWLAAPEIGALLRRSAYPAAPEDAVQVERERPFARRVGDEIQEGFIDRLVLTSREGRITAAHVLDFKTDDVAPGDEQRLGERTVRYRPQMEAYRAVAAEQYALPLGTVRGTLLFLAAGRAVEVR
jgi:ATP-dependent exoDNAse (exonuclease V) beta subunit